MGTVNIRSRAISDGRNDMGTVSRSLDICPVITFHKWVRRVKTYFRERNGLSRCNHEGAT